MNEDFHSGMNEDCNVAGMQQRAVYTCRAPLVAVCRKLNSCGLLGFSKSESKVLSMFQQKMQHCTVLQPIIYALLQIGHNYRAGSPLLTPFYVKVTGGALRIPSTYLAWYLHCMHFEDTGIWLSISHCMPCKITDVANQRRRTRHTSAL